MVGGPMKLAVNQFILNNPTAALEVTGGLMAGAVTLAVIMKAVGVKESDLPAGGMAEVELLDEEAPERFFGRAVSYVHASLAEWKMRGDLSVPQVGWDHGRWDLRLRVGGTRVPLERTEELRAHQVVDVSTPVLSNGKLV